jgi:hypothetical protein
MKVRLGEARPSPEKERGTTSTSSLGSGYSPTGAIIISSVADPRHFGTDPDPSL